MINQNQDKNKSFIATKRKRSESGSSKDVEQDKFFRLSGPCHKTQNYSMPLNNSANYIPVQNFNKFKVNLKFLKI